MEKLAVVERSIDLGNQQWHNISSILGRELRHVTWHVREVTEVELQPGSVKWEYRFSQTGCGSL
jgi:hypothetical protein